MPKAEAAWSVSGRAKARAKGRRDGSTCLFLSRILSRESIMIWELFGHHDLGVIWSQNVLPSVICVTKLLDIVRNLCHVLGEPTLEN